MALRTSGASQHLLLSRRKSVALPDKPALCCCLKIAYYMISITSRCCTVSVPLKPSKNKQQKVCTRLGGCLLVQLAGRARGALQRRASSVRIGIIGHCDVLRASTLQSGQAEEGCTNEECRCVGKRHAHCRNSRLSSVSRTAFLVLCRFGACSLVARMTRISYSRTLFPAPLRRIKKQRLA